MRRAIVPFLILAVSVAAPCAAEPAAAPAPRPSLKQALAELKVPPAWFATTTVSWDTARPWKEARLEVRRLLAGDAVGAREGVKLTWLYAQKSDIGDGHELSLYLFLSGNTAWALQEYERHLKAVAGKGATHAYLAAASCYAHFGEHDKALERLTSALLDLPPKPWRISSLATVHDHLGDLYAKRGDAVKAREHYAEAIRLYPTSDQPWGRHLLPRRAAKVQTKLDLLAMQSLQAAQLKDGTYTGRSLGYADDKELEVTVTVAGGRIADVKVRHEEKIDLNAAELIPQRIVARQSLQVDAVTGATVTSQAVVDGAFQALKQAGLK